MGETFECCLSRPSTLGTLKNGEFCGEDYTFCDRWRAIDGKVWVDKDIALRHVGTTTHTGSLREIFFKK
jgi:hypothetical protein